MAPGLGQLLTLFRRRETVDWIAPSSGLLAGLEAGAQLVDPVALVAVGGFVLFARSRRGLELPPRDARPGIVLLWFAVPLLLITLLPPMLGINLLHARYLVVATPAVLLLYGVLLAMPRGGQLLRTLPLVVYVSLVVSLQLVPLLSRDGGPFWWFLKHGWESATNELVRGYRDGDLILYRTGFVELDDVVRGRASAATIEFVEWPLLAHLPKDREFRRRPLPYSDTPEMRARLASMLPEVAAARRLWVLGLDPVDTTSESFAGLLAMATQGRPMEVLASSNYRVVQLFLLRDLGAGGEGGSHRGRR
jgi:hypothetical protein